MTSCDDVTDDVIIQILRPKRSAKLAQICRYKQRKIQPKANWVVYDVFSITLEQKKRLNLAPKIIRIFTIKMYAKYKAKKSLKSFSLITLKSHMMALW